MKKRQGKTFWIEKDENGNVGIGPTRGSCDRDFPEAIAPKLKDGEAIRVRIVAAPPPRKEDERG